MKYQIVENGVYWEITPLLRFCLKDGKNILQQKLIRSVEAWSADKQRLEPKIESRWRDVPEMKDIEQEEISSI